MPRVFLGLTEIAGYYRGLARGLEELGVACLHANLTPYEIATSGPRRPTPAIVRFARRCAIANMETPRSRLVLKLWRKALATASRLAVLVWAIPRFDIFVFGFQSTFAGYRELRLLRAIGKHVVYVFHGSDTRPPYLDGSLMASDRGWGPAECIAFTARTRRMLDAVERSAHVIVSNPLSSQLHERPFVSFLALGVPRTCPDWLTPTEHRGTLRIVHSPSHPEAKGTPEVVAAVERLRSRGIELELVQLTGRPNREVLEALADCEFVVDQLYSDTAMAALASEAACFGKPTIVGTYGAAAIKEAHRGMAVPPVHLCRPDEIESAIELLARDEEYRRRLGEEAQRFVREQWSPAAVAQRFLDVVEGRADPSWLVDPSTIRYAHGCGFPEERLATVVRDVVNEGGVAALRLSEKPELERRVLELARGGSLNLPEQGATSISPR